MLSLSCLSQICFISPTGTHNAQSYNTLNLVLHILVCTAFEIYRNVQLVTGPGCVALSSLRRKAIHSSQSMRALLLSRKLKKVNKFAFLFEEIPLVSFNSAEQSCHHLHTFCSAHIVSA